MPEMRPSTRKGVGRQQKGNGTMPSEDEHIEIHTNDATLIPKVIEFIQSASYQEKEEIIRRHPALLDKEADSILAQIEAMWAGRGDMQTARSISAWREFLSRVAETDFEMAVLEKRVMAAFVGLPDDRAGEYISRLTTLFPELLNERADEAFRNVKARLANDEDGHDVAVMIFDAMQQAAKEQRLANMPFIEELEKARDKNKGTKWSAKGLFR